MTRKLEPVVVDTIDDFEEVASLMNDELGEYWQTLCELSRMKDCMFGAFADAFDRELASEMDRANEHFFLSHEERRYCTVIEVLHCMELSESELESMGLEFEEDE